MLSVRLNQWADKPPAPGAAVLVHARKGGLSIDFEGEVQEYLSKPVPALLISMPRQVVTRSLRRSGRVLVGIPAWHRWYATVAPDPYPVEKGLILDISKGGVALAVVRAPEHERHVEVSFTVPGHVGVDAECVKRYVRPCEDGEYAYTVGLKFIMIPPQQQKAISLFAASALTKRRG